LWASQPSDCFSSATSMLPRFFPKFPLFLSSMSPVIFTWVILRRNVPDWPTPFFASLPQGSPHPSVQIRIFSYVFWLARSKTVDLGLAPDSREVVRSPVLPFLRRRSLALWFPFPLAQLHGPFYSFASGFGLFFLTGEMFLFFPPYIIFPPRFFVLISLLDDTRTAPNPPNPF